MDNYFLKFCYSLPDVDSENLNLESNSVSFMETLLSRQHGQVGLQNGFSPPSFEESGSDAINVQHTREEDKKNAATSLEQICPVGLQKAALLYPPSAQSQ